MYAPVETWYLKTLNKEVPLYSDDETIANAEFAINVYMKSTDTSALR